MSGRQRPTTGRRVHGKEFEVGEEEEEEAGVAARENVTFYEPSRGPTQFSSSTAPAAPPPSLDTEYKSGYYRRPIRSTSPAESRPSSPDRSAELLTTKKVDGIHQVNRVDSLELWTSGPARILEQRTPRLSESTSGGRPGAASYQPVVIRLPAGIAMDTLRVEDARSPSETAGVGISWRMTREPLQVQVQAQDGTVWRGTLVTDDTLPEDVRLSVSSGGGFEARVTLRNARRVVTSTRGRGGSEVEETEEKDVFSTVSFIRPQWIGVLDNDDGNGQSIVLDGVPPRVVKEGLPLTLAYEVAGLAWQPLLQLRTLHEYDGNGDSDIDDDYGGGGGGGGARYQNAQHPGDAPERKRVELEPGRQALRLELSAMIRNNNNKNAIWSVGRLTLNARERYRPRVVYHGFAEDDNGGDRNEALFERRSFARASMAAPSAPAAAQSLSVIAAPLADGPNSEIENNNNNHLADKGREPLRYTLNAAATGASSSRRGGRTGLVIGKFDTNLILDRSDVVVGFWRWKARLPDAATLARLTAMEEASITPPATVIVGGAYQQENKQKGGGGGGGAGRYQQQQQPGEPTERVLVIGPAEMERGRWDGRLPTSTFRVYDTSGRIESEGVLSETPAGSRISFSTGDAWLVLVSHNPATPQELAALDSTSEGSTSLPKGRPEGSPSGPSSPRHPSQPDLPSSSSEEVLPALPPTVLLRRPSGSNGGGGGGNPSGTTTLTNSQTRPAFVRLSRMAPAGMAAVLLRTRILSVAPLSSPSSSSSPPPSSFSSMHHYRGKPHISTRRQSSALPVWGIYGMDNNSAWPLVPFAAEVELDSPRGVGPVASPEVAFTVCVPPRSTIRLVWSYVLYRP